MLYLGGGGSDNDESQLWDRVFTSGQRVAVWPFAQPEENWPPVMQWLTAALSKRGSFTIAIGKEPPSFGLADADVLVIPGGNVFDLLDFMNRHHLSSLLTSFLSRGGLYYGGSAGAVILGKDASIVDAAKGGLDENLVGLVDTAGMNLVGGSAVQPHLDEGWYEYCKTWVGENGADVVGIPEKCGVVIDPAGQATNCGPEQVLIFKTNGETQTIEQGKTWSLAEWKSPDTGM